MPPGGTHAARRDHAPVGDEPGGRRALQRRGHHRDAGQVVTTHRPGGVHPSRHGHGGQARGGRAAVVGDDQAVLHGLAEAGVEIGVARGAQAHLPVAAGKRGGDVDQRVRGGQAHGGGADFVQHQPPVGCRPFRGAAPVDGLGDGRGVGAGRLQRATGFHQAAGRAALEGFVDVEIAGVRLGPAGDRHVRVHVVGGDPERVVVRVVGRALAGHQEALGREHREQAGPEAPLRQPQQRPAFVERHAPVRARPGALRQRDGGIHQREPAGAVAAHAPPVGVASRPRRSARAWACSARRHTVNTCAWGIAVAVRSRTSARKRRK